MDPTKRRIPSRVRRTLFVLCHAFLPYLLDKFLVCLENELEREQEGISSVRRRRHEASTTCSLESWLRRWIQRAVGLLSESQRRACLPATFVLHQGLTLLHRFHVALFYISGSFYHLSRRMAGISYVGQFLSPLRHVGLALLTFTNLKSWKWLPIRQSLLSPYFTVPSGKINQRCLISDISSY